MSHSSGPVVTTYKSPTSEAVHPPCDGLSIDLKTPGTIGTDSSLVRLHDDNKAESLSIADSRRRHKTARQREDDMARETRDRIDGTLADLEGQMAELRDHQASRGREITNLTLRFEEMGKDLGRLQAQFETLQCQIGELKCDSEVPDLAVLQLRRLRQRLRTRNSREELAQGDDEYDEHDDGPEATSFARGICQRS